MSVGQESGRVHSQGFERSVKMRGSDCQNRTVLGVSCSLGSRLRRAFRAVLWPSWPLWCCTWKLERAVQRDKGQLPHLSRAPISPTHSVLCTKNLYVDMTGRWEPSPCGLEVGGGGRVSDCLFHGPESWVPPPSYFLSPSCLEPCVHRKEMGQVPGRLLGLCCSSALPWLGLTGDENVRVLPKRSSTLVTFFLACTVWAATSAAFSDMTYLEVVGDQP